MKKILVATDFSACAVNALNYAVALAKDKDKEIILLHANNISGFQTGFLLAEGGLGNSNFQLIDQQLKEEINRVQSQFGFTAISSEVYIGDVSEGLKEKCQQGDIFLTIMGTTGENSSGLLWGSKSMNTMRTHNGPILIIPPTAAYKKVEKIMLSMDIERINSHYPFEAVKSWIKEMHAQLDILNIEPFDPFSVQDNSTVLEQFKDLNYAFKSLESEQLQDAISYYLEQYKADWILVIPKKYNFFESLFHKSKSEIISKASNVPILAIHP